jgi:hypothetical protein
MKHRDFSRLFHGACGAKLSCRSRATGEMQRREARREDG